MTFYQEKLQALRRNIYSNDAQLKTVIGFRKYIDTHYQEDLNLDDLSATLFVSKYHLIRLFKRYYGQTPRQYLIDRRIYKSKEKLKSGMTVTETCFAIGFESPGSFSTLFKSRTGKSPRQYQKEQFSRSD
jgi:AraC-like DNA-binding protein